MRGLIKERAMKKILIIEDHETLLTIYSNFLSSLGVETLKAKSVWEAADTLITQKIDLVLLDLNLPEMDGKDFIDIIYEHDPNLKVIVCSVEPVERQIELIPTAVDYFDKSQSFHLLLRKVAYALYNDHPNRAQNYLKVR